MIPTVCTKYETEKYDGANDCLLLRSPAYILCRILAFPLVGMSHQAHFPSSVETMNKESGFRLSKNLRNRPLEA